jgi:hypothetical protein
LHHRGGASYAGTVESRECSGPRQIERYRERYGYLPQTLAADTTYGNGELLQWLDERGIAAYIRVKEIPMGRLACASARGELLHLPRRQASEIRRHRSAQP